MTRLVLRRGLPSIRVTLIPAVLVVGVSCGGGQGPAVGAEPVADQTSEPAVTAADLDRQPNRPIEEILASRFPGVTVTRDTYGRLSIRIRGQSSFHGDTAPLYVIDGVAIHPDADPLHGINPRDIESIRVIKDAAALTMYGSRGANGVIEIKTKQSSSTPLTS